MIEIPPMNFVAVRGLGDPNEEGAYKDAVSLLYAVSFTLKMSYKGKYSIEGYFPYVVPPLEGLWIQEGSSDRIDYSRKRDFRWISMIRLPDFISRQDFSWAVAEVEKKKKKDFSAVEFFTYNEGLWFQCMHGGSYDEEPESSIEKMEAFARQEGYKTALSEIRRHHEIYLNDPRRDRGITAENRDTDSGEKNGWLITCKRKPPLRDPAEGGFLSFLLSLFMDFCPVRIRFHYEEETLSQTIFQRFIVGNLRCDHGFVNRFSHDFGG